MSRSASQIIGGPFDFSNGLMLIIDAIVIVEFTIRYKKFKETRSPLFFCYVFILLGEIVLTTKAIGTTLLEDIPIIFEVGFSFLFTAYSLVVYSWIMAIYSIKFVENKWRVLTKWIYVLVVLIIFASAVTSGFLRTVYILTFVVSILLVVAYFVTYRVLQTYFASVNNKRLAALSKVANWVVGVTTIVLIVYIILAMPYPESVSVWIAENRPRKIQIIPQVLVLVYNLRKMSKAPPTVKLNFPPSTPSASVTPSGVSSLTSLYTNNNDNDNNDENNNKNDNNNTPAIEMKISSPIPAFPNFSSPEDNQVDNPSQKYSTTSISYHSDDLDSHNDSLFMDSDMGITKRNTNNSLSQIITDSSQMFTNISQFEQTYTHVPATDSPGLSQVFFSNSISSVSLPSSISNLSSSLHSNCSMRNSNYSSASVSTPSVLRSSIQEFASSRTLHASK